jgi:altronate dehydratase
MASAFCCTKEDAAEHAKTPTISAGLSQGYIHHPNVAGATVLNLGCQHAQIAILRDEIRRRDPKFDKPLFILEQQRSGSEASMMSDAIRQTFLGLVEANKTQRTLAPLPDLCVGLKCGDSDGFSGISAIPPLDIPPICSPRWGAERFCLSSRSCAEWNEN